MKRTRSASFSSLSTIEVLAIPTEESTVSDFTMSGNCNRAGRFTLAPISYTAKSGTLMRWYASNFLESALPRAMIIPRGLHPVYGTCSNSR